MFLNVAKVIKVWVKVSQKKDCMNMGLVIRVFI